MPKIKITFPDNSKKEFDKGVTGAEIATSISEGLARAALAVNIDNNLQDLNMPITKDSKVKIITFRDDEGKQIFWHSSSHLMAAAIKKIYPHAKFGIGPAVETGFYYDLDVQVSIDDFPKIEEEMKRLVKEKVKFERKVMKKNEALKLFIHDELKSELIEEKGENNVSVYKLNKFADFCRGPHVPDAGKIKAFKLTKVAGAYWKGDANNVQLTRVYGISFPDKKDLKKYVVMLEEAEKRDHRKIGKKMDLFSLHEEGPGFIFFHDKGTFMYNTLIDFMRKELRKRNYQETITPIILNKSLWLKSGHWDHYKEDMYFTKIDKQDFAVKPMNCPGNILVYNSRMHSYRELPIRSGEFGLVHRHELSGVLAGLFRVRAFTQDDAHIICTDKQIESEIIELMKLTDYIYKVFGFEYEVELSTKPEKAMGSDEMWDKATDSLKNALDKVKIKYKINPGDGAFYGPKIDFHIKDALGRRWQCGTIQVDFAMPEKFDMNYEGNDNRKHRPAMLHRTIYGSIERFLGILIEHYAGKFPAWLNPIQARIITVADRFEKYAKKIRGKMEASGLRVEVDSRSESVSRKVRDSQLAQVNYSLVVGEKEEKNSTVTIRARNNEVLGAKKVDAFIKQVLKEVEEKK